MVRPSSCPSPILLCRIHCRFSLVLFLIVCHSLYPQFESETDRHRSRLGIQYGHAVKDMPWSHLEIPYDYEASLLQLQYFYAIKTGRTFAFDIVLAPQYNTSTYRKVNSVGEFYDGYELGLTAGISPRVKTGNGSLGFYLLITSGPMYVSGTPDRQAEGFNFSSTAATGLQIRLLKKAYLDLRTGFRHLSNARLKEPNAGVNNLVWSVGLSYVLTSIKKNKPQRFLAGVAH